MALGPLGGGWVYDTFGNYAWLYIGSGPLASGAVAISLAFPPSPAPTAASPRRPEARLLRALRSAKVAPTAPRGGGLRDGVLFVATGAGYRTLAARAAASVARVSPGPADRPLRPTSRCEPGDFADVTCSRTSGSARASTRWRAPASSARCTSTPTCWRSPTSATSSRCSTASTSRSPTTRRRNSPAANAVWRRAAAERLPAVQRRRHRLPPHARRCSPSSPPGPTRCARAA